MSIHVQSAVVHAVRAFIAAFIVLYPASDVIGAASGSQPIDVSALRSGLVAGLIAVVAFAWRAWVDRLNVPTLVAPDVKRPA